MNPKATPIFGAILGLLLGLVIVGLLSQTGVVPPDRLWLFGISGLLVWIVAWITTQRVTFAKKRFIAVTVLAGILLGVGLAGIPETVNGGSISDECTLEVQSSLSEGSPADTSAFEPFDVAPDETITWQASSETAISNGTRSLGVLVGGFPLAVWSADLDNSEGFTEFEGTVDVEQGLEDLKDNIGLDLRGTFHFAGELDGENASCQMTGYARVAPNGAFGTDLLVGLWIALGVLLVTVITTAIVVGRSHRGAAPAGGATVTQGTGGSASPGLDQQFAPSAATQSVPPTRPIPTTPPPLAQPPAQPAQQPPARPPVQQPPVQQPPVQQPPARPPVQQPPVQQPPVQQPPVQQPPVQQPPATEPPAPPPAQPPPGQPPTA